MLAAITAWGGRDSRSIPQRTNLANVVLQLESSRRLLEICKRSKERGWLYLQRRPWSGPLPPETLPHGLARSFRTGPLPAAGPGPSNKKNGSAAARV